MRFYLQVNIRVWVSVRVRVGVGVGVRCCALDGESKDILGVSI